jgi:DNA-binding NarL/FixJ family response regulator
MLIQPFMTLADLGTIPCFRGWSLGSQNSPRGPLTPREQQILHLVIDGRTQKEVAFELGVSESTVRVLYSRAMKKLGRSKQVRRRP